MHHSFTLTCWNVLSHMFHFQCNELFHIQTDNN